MVRRRNRGGEVIESHLRTEAAACERERLWPPRLCSGRRPVSDSVPSATER
jgi:hypothetical protein